MHAVQVRAPFALELVDVKAAAARVRRKAPIGDLTDVDADRTHRTEERGMVDDAPADNDGVPCGPPCELLVDPPPADPAPHPCERITPARATASRAL